MWIVTFDDISKRFLYLLFCLINNNWLGRRFYEIVEELNWFMLGFLLLYFYFWIYHHFLRLTLFHLSYLSKGCFWTDFQCHLWILRSLSTAAQTGISGFCQICWAVTWDNSKYTLFWWLFLFFCRYFFNLNLFCLCVEGSFGGKHFFLFIFVNYFHFQRIKNKFNCIGVLFNIKLLFELTELLFHSFLIPGSIFVFLMNL